MKNTAKNTTVDTAPNGDTQTTIVMPTFTVVIEQTDRQVVMNWIPNNSTRVKFQNGTTDLIASDSILTARLKPNMQCTAIWSFSTCGTNHSSDHFSRVADCFADAQQRTASWNG